MTARKPETPAVPPTAGPAARASGGAAATPGTPVSPVTGTPGTSLLPGQQPGGREAQSSRPGRAHEPAPGAGTSGLRGEEWAAAVRKATADLHKAQRNRRGKWRPKWRNPFGTASGVRIPPPGGAA